MEWMEHYGTTATFVESNVILLETSQALLIQPMLYFMKSN